MPIETERKFLVKSDEWRKKAKGISYRQGYLSTKVARTVRVRIAGEKAYITVKGKNKGASRAEYEYGIPVADATEILDNLCKKPLIEKKRYTFKQNSVTWEVDEFEGDNEGLVVAEVELEDENQVIILPNWIGKEVTGKAQYYNASLVKKPFSKW